MRTNYKMVVAYVETSRCVDPARGVHGWVCKSAFEAGILIGDGLAANRITTSPRRMLSGGSCPRGMFATAEKQDLRWWVDNAPARVCSGDTVAGSEAV